MISIDVESRDSASSTTTCTSYIAIEDIIFQMATVHKSINFMGYLDKLAMYFSTCIVKFYQKFLNDVCEAENFYLIFFYFIFYLLIYLFIYLFYFV